MIAFNSQPSNLSKVIYALGCFGSSNELDALRADEAVGVTEHLFLWRAVAFNPHRDSNDVQSYGVDADAERQCGLLVAATGRQLEHNTQLL